jgi:hypothetical protein
VGGGREVVRVVEDLGGVVGLFVDDVLSVVGDVEVSDVE